MAALSPSLVIGGGGQGQGQGQTTTKNLLDNDLTLLLPELFQVIIMHLIRYRLIPVIPT